MNARFRPFFVTLFIALLAVLAGCAAESKRDGSPAAPSAPPSVASTPSADRARIVAVTMRIRVPNVTDASDHARHEIEGAGGYVQASNRSAGEDGNATMDLRVPADQVSAVRSALRAMGCVISESETVQDVTKQRADLGARLSAARAQEKRLLEIMQNKTGSISDVIESERELARVRENIEKLEAEQRTMDGKVAMATIHLTLMTPSSAAWQTPGPSVSQAWHAGIRGAESLAVYAAMAFAALAPTLVPLACVVVLLLVFVRRARAKRTALLTGR